MMARYKDLNKAKQEGIVYTSARLAQYTAEQLVAELDLKGRKEISIIDPAAGDGILLKALIEVLRQRNSGLKIKALAIDSNYRGSLPQLSPCPPGVDITAIKADFLSFCAEGKVTGGTDFDALIANPPYVRTQILPEEVREFLRARLGLKGKVDVYYAFLMLGIELLTEGGCAAYITSNKYLTIKSAQGLREHLYHHASLVSITDFGDTKLFKAAVLPCVTVARREQVAREITFKSVYECSGEGELLRNDLFAALHSPGRYLGEDGRSFEVKCGRLELNEGNFAAPWVMSTNESKTWLERVNEKTWRLFGEVSKVKVGIKSNADSVFLLSDEDAGVQFEPELVRDLITHRNAGQFFEGGGRRWKVLYPHYSEGKRTKAYDLSAYPLAQSYLQSHFAELNARSYLHQNHREWYELWVPQKPFLWQHRKIVFRDISAQPQFWYDDTGAVVNGDCYWMEFGDMVSDDLIFLMLAIANSSFIEKFYDSCFNTKLYCAKRRFMSQYVERFPLFNPTDSRCVQIAALSREIWEHKEVSPEPKRAIDALLEELINS